MTTVLRKSVAEVLPPRAIEAGFPMVPLSRLAEKESWRKELGRPLYHIHKWWATRLGSVFRAINIAALTEHPSDTWSQFYTKHNLSGKIVLDPFMGSGTTLGEALKLGCSVVGCDINPISTFLVRQALTPVSEARLRAAYARVEADVRDEIRRYYTTTDRQTGEPIQVLYGFWVKVLTTPAGEELPLFSSRIFARDAYPKKRPKAQLVCPECWEVFEDRYDCVMAACPTCRATFNPQTGPAAGQYLTDSKNVKHKIKELVPSDGSPPKERLFALMALRADGRKVYLKPIQEDHLLYQEAAERLESEELQLPTAEVRPGHNTNQARGYNFTKWSDFFNERQKLCLGLLLRAIMDLEDVPAQEQLLCLFSSTLEFNNRFCSFKGEGTGAVRHMFSHHILKPERMPLENSVWGGKRTSGTFASLFESRLLPAKRYLDEPFEVGGQGGLFEDGGPGTGRTVASAPMRPVLVKAMTPDRPRQAALILNGDSAKLPLADRSIDAVVTDPPYFDFIHYSELSDFFYAWLGPVLSERYHYFNRDNSSAIGEVQHKDAPTFAKLLGRVFAESARVLKDEGVLAFSFHHSRAEGWSAIYDALNQAGLVVVASHPIHAELRGSSPKSGAADPISLDAILVCRKRSSVARAPASDEEVLARVQAKAGELRGGGLYISKTDEFVICAGEVLSACQGGASVGEVETRIDKLRALLVRPNA